MSRDPAAPPQTWARTAGALYLVVFALGIWSQLGVRESLIVFGDAAATAANVRAAEGLFRASIAADALVFSCDVVVAVLFYVLLRPAGAVMALAAAAFRLAMAAALAFNLLNQLMAVQLLTGDAYAGLGAAGVEALALSNLEAHAFGYDLILILFAGHCLIAGGLIFRSGYLPKILGLGLGLSGLVYIAGGLVRILAPEHADALLPAYALPMLAEGALALWLVVKGVDGVRWRARRGESGAP